jgi:hypothetical protein
MYILRLMYPCVFISVFTWLDLGGLGLSNPLVTHIGMPQAGPHMAFLFCNGASLSLALCVEGSEAQINVSGWCSLIL